MKYYRQSDADLAYEQIEMFDKLLKNHNISYEKRACMYWKLDNILIL